MSDLFEKTSSDASSAILKQKLAVFSEFLSATESLKGCLLSQDMQQVDRLIRHRQKLIGVIDELDIRMKNTVTTPFRTLTADMGQNHERIMRGGGVWEILEKTIAAVIQLNEDCTIMATSLHDKMGKELQGISDQRLARRGYAGGENGVRRSSRLLNTEV